MNRDLTKPIPATTGAAFGRCGFVVDVDTMGCCGDRPLYELRLSFWPTEQPPAQACAQHASVARTWGSVEWMRSLS